jgi:uncharacterized damage-inducible protein DinB
MYTAFERLRHLFQYEQDSHEQVLEAFRSAPAEAKQSEAYQKALDMMAHIIAARLIWLWRIGGTANRPETVFPKQTEQAALEALIRSMESDWRQYLDKLDDAELERWLDYKTLDGREFRSRIDDILTQLHGHSMYHRGQISIWMREAGATPAPTDYLRWAMSNVL